GWSASCRGEAMTSRLGPAGPTRGIRRALVAALVLAVVAALPSPARSFGELPGGAPGKTSDPASDPIGSKPPVVASGLPTQLREVGFDQRLDQPVPLDVPLLDESGREVRLRDYLGARPVLLQLAYYHCPMLCPIVLGGLVSSLKALSFDAGK